MAVVYQPEVWRDLFVMLGTAAATLVGLLFVVMSLYFNALGENPDHNMSATVHAARNNTYHLLTVMVTAALVLTPQPASLLGAELIAIHLFGLRLPIVFTRAHIIRGHAIFPLSMTITIAAGYLLGAAGGAALIVKSGWGPYLVTASCIILLVRTVLTAWMLMFGTRHAEALANADAGDIARGGGGR